MLLPEENVKDSTEVVLVVTEDLAEDVIDFIAISKFTFILQLSFINNFSQQ